MKQYLIDGEAILTRDDLYRIVREEWKLENCFGSNLDALHDALTDEPAVTVEIRHADALKEHLGNYADALFYMLESTESVTLIRD